MAPAFLSWLGVPPDRRWLDVGCGTGALCTAIRDRCEPSSIVGLEPSSGFLSTARARLGGQVTFLQGNASEIPLEDDAVDIVVSGLVLNFIPDPLTALMEMERVASPGGMIGAYVWDYAGQMQLIRFFWDAASEIDARAAELDEGVRFPLCHPDALSRLFAAGRLADVEVTGIEISTPFASFAEYWHSFLGGQGPAPTYLTSLDAMQRKRLRDRLRERLPVEPDGSIPLDARAWAARGTVVQRT